MHLLLVAVYVVDLLVTGSKLEMIISSRRICQYNVKMSDLGKLTYYLGIEVLKYKGGITLNQERYTKRPWKKLE